MSQIINSEELTGNIEKLPCDLKIHIFNTYLVPQQCEIFLNWLENNNAIDMTPNVFTQEIDNVIVGLLNNKKCLNYLFKENDNIKKMYIRHYIKRERAFNNMSVRKSFVTSILMYMWH